jgi:hypothetical protein
LSSVFAAVFDDMGGTATGARGIVWTRFSYHRIYLLP